MHKMGDHSLSSIISSKTRKEREEKELYFPTEGEEGVCWLPSESLALSPVASEEACEI